MKEPFHFISLPQLLTKSLKKELPSNLLIKAQNTPNFLTLVFYHKNQQSSLPAVPSTAGIIIRL